MRRRFALNGELLAVCICDFMAGEREARMRARARERKR